MKAPLKITGIALTLLLVSVGASLGVTSMILSRVCRPGQDTERSYIVHSAGIYDDSHGRQLNSFRYRLNFDALRGLDVTSLRLACWAELCTEDGKVLDRWEDRKPIPAGTSGCITIRAALEGSKIRCKIVSVSDVPGFQGDFVASPQEWSGGLSDSSGYMTILERGRLMSQGSARRPYELMRYGDGGNTLRIMVSFVYKDPNEQL